MKTRIPKLLSGVPLAVHLLTVKAEAAVALPLAQIPSNVKTGFQYGLGLLFMIGFPIELEKLSKLKRRVDDLLCRRDHFAHALQG